MHEFLTEEMSAPMALSQFGLSFGQFKDMSPEQLRARWKQLIKSAHPDLPQNAGKGNLAADINAAYDFLKNYHANSSIGDQPSGFSPSKPEPFRRSSQPYEVPVWQPDKESTNNKIHVESYRDKNYFKKHIWELSDGSTDSYTITAFGNNNMFEGRIKVYGNYHLFGEMINAMLVYNANGNKLSVTRAVFVTHDKDPSKMYLIYADGKNFANRPIPLDFDEQKKKNFEQKIPEILDHIKNLYKGR